MSIKCIPDSSVELDGAIKDVFKFLQWKIQPTRKDFNENDVRIIENQEYSSFFDLSPKSSSYTKTLISKYTECLWYTKLRNEFMTEGFTFQNHRVAACRFHQT